MKRIDKVLLIVKRTTLSRLKSSQSSADQKLLRKVRSGESATRTLRLAHEEHLASLRQVRAELRNRDIEFIERVRVPKTLPRRLDLIVTVGGDGTLLEASHYVKSNHVMLGVNSAPTSSVGFLTACRGPTFAQTLDRLEAEKLTPVAVQRLRIRLGRKYLPEPVLNDVLFCHDNPAMVSRYELTTPSGKELQRSSGVWISTPAGSTAAFRSAGGTPMSLTSRSFGYIVREPYAPPGSAVRFLGEVLEWSQHLSIESRVASASLFVDGSYRRYPIRYGDTVSFSLHPKALNLVRMTNR